MTPFPRGVGGVGVIYDPAVGVICGPVEVNGIETSGRVRSCGGQWGRERGY